MTYASPESPRSFVASIIRDHSASRPRNMQRAVGPSGSVRRATGTGYGILGTERVNDPDPLASWIGTASHASMEQALAGSDDWVTEIATELDGYGIVGTADAYHRPTRTVVDWKFVGQSSLTKYKANGPGRQYRTQAHLYTGPVPRRLRRRQRGGGVHPGRNGMLSGVYAWSGCIRTTRW